MSRAFITVFGIADEKGLIDGEPVSMTKTAVAAVRKGYAVVPLKPGTKVPDICTLTARDLKEAGPRHACGVAHHITDDATARRVFDRVGKSYDAPLNLGVVAGPSRLINVDADTKEAVQAFQNDWADAEGDPGYLAHSPTVLTPGAFRDGQWRHSDGGHFYFEVPDDFDWTTYPTTVLKAPGGYDVRWGLQMSVVPPSTRKEGPYTPLGDVLTAPQFLLDMIEESKTRSLAREQRRSELYANDTIATWAAKVSWEELLTFDGWTSTSKADNCGCPIFEKPGGGSTTYKSATGHEGHCTDAHYENIEGHGPLHVWTTDPPAPLDWYVTNIGQTITKLRYVALTRFDDDVAAAKMGLGIDEEPNLDEWLGTTPAALHVTSVTAVTEAPSHESHDPWGDDVTPCDEVPDPPIPTSSEPSHGNPEVDPTPILDAVMARFNHPASRMPLIKSAFAKALDEHVARTAKDEYVRALSGKGPESLLDLIDNFADTDPTLVTSSPSMLERTDGQCLYHRGRVNFIVGRRGCGKTWLAMLTVAQVLDAGGSALYFDFEDNYSLFAERMADIGVDIATPKGEGRFVYLNAFETNLVNLPAFVARVGKFDLVVFDVINRMISRLGGSPDVGNEESIWLSDNLFDPIADHDTAVLVLDHPNKKGQAKDAEVEALNPGGGSMKGNNASGVMVGMRAVRPFTRKDPAGHIKLFCLKDRTGFFADEDCIGELRGQMDLHSTGIGLSLRVDPPDAEVEADRGITGDIDDTKARVLAILAAAGPLKRGHLNSKVTTSLRPWLDVSIEALCGDNLITYDPESKVVSLVEDPS